MVKKINHYIKEDQLHMKVNKNEMKMETYKNNIQTLILQKKFVKLINIFIKDQIKMFSCHTMNNMVFVRISLKMLKMKTKIFTKENNMTLLMSK